MSCEICAFDTSVDSVMWSCAGCPRVFHPACIGITATVLQQTRGSLRKKEKKPATSYLLPCCEACQKLVEAKLDFHRLSEQQKALTDQLHANTQVIHQLTLQQNKPSVLNEAIEGLEVLLTSIKYELGELNKNSTLAGSVVTIKNHVTSVFDSTMQTTNDRISKSLEAVTMKLAVDLNGVRDEICQLNQLAIDAAATATMTTNPMLELNILDELRSLSAQIMTSQYPAPSPEPSQPNSFTSLQDEINATSGWRVLGKTKVWRADWSEYDERKNRRNNQQKMADKAKKRRKQIQARKHKSNINNSNNNNSHNNYRIQNCNNFNNNENGHQRSFNNTTRNTVWNVRRNYQLPPDRELLAEAKERFSQPPTNYGPTAHSHQVSGSTATIHRPIQFQRGETLNPYPNEGELPQRLPGSLANYMPTGCSSCSAAPCGACCIQHTCFRRH